MSNEDYRNGYLGKVGVDFISSLCSSVHGTRGHGCQMSIETKLKKENAESSLAKVGLKSTLKEIKLE